MSLPDQPPTPRPAAQKPQPWQWRLEDASGAELPTPAGLETEGFPSQADAESWVGEFWRELREQGVDAVTLFEADRLVYGPMSLHE